MLQGIILCISGCINANHNIPTPFVIFTFCRYQNNFLIPTPMIIIQDMLNSVNGNSHNVQWIILYIFVIFTFMISGEYSYCSGNQTFDVKYIPSVDNIFQLWGGYYLQQYFLRISVSQNVGYILQLCLMCSQIKVLILGVCGIIRSLNRVLLGL